MATIAQIRGLNKDLENTIKAREEAKSHLNEALKDFIGEVQKYLDEVCKPNMTIGSTKQGILIGNDGLYTLYGLFTRAILDGYIDSFASTLQEAIEKEVQRINYLKG